MARRKGVGPGIQESTTIAFKARCLPGFRCALSLRPEVEANIAEAEAWYEERQEGLGKEFTPTVSLKGSRYQEVMKPAL